MKRRIRKGGVLNIKSKMWYLGACGVLVAAGMGGLGAVNEASAVLEYSSAAGVNFTISPSITVTVSGDLLIDELAPGNYSDSNIITVGVATNTMAGYHLSATAGTASTNTRLTNADDSNYYFGNLSGNVSTLAGFNDNTWGYAYSTDSGSTWVSGDADSASAGYNGLPLDNNDEGATGVTLIDTSTTADSRTVKFKIGAKASNVQASGTYNNTVNFYAVAYDAPVGLADAYASAGKTMHNGYYKMQDMSTAICGAVDVVPSELQVIDVRDDNVYWITKLADGHCWMTQNLDLNLSTSTALTSEDTNLKVASGNGYSTGYSESGGVITYTPSMATTNSWEGSNRNNFSDWDNTDGIQQKTPKSWDTGLYYEDGTYFA
ncbi:hypothetical protein IKG05_01420, partial [Candidatus Saccharibacteria bacterium]|nr:hypothetical protein [Candidatus Saccharibacteria bacterium]